MNLKKIFPEESYILTTKLSVDEVKKRISESILQKKNSSLAEFHNPLKRKYEGKLFNDTFQINQVIVERRNSFAPLITGKINSSFNKTNVEVKMELLPFVRMFMSFWLGVIGLACVVILFVGLLQFREILSEGFSPMIMIPFILFIFGCYLTFGGFKSQSENSKYFLANLLEGQQIESA